VKRHCDQGNSYKRKHILGLTDSFRGLAYYHGGKHGSVQADMMLEMLRVLRVDPQIARRN
jgi:phenylalanyl-tRNA synthetase beta subunit